MKKQIIILFSGLMGMPMLADTFNSPTTTTGSMSQHIPIIVRKNGPQKGAKMPSQQIMLEGVVSEELIQLKLPVEWLPCEVTIESLSDGINWTGVMVDENSCWMDFDGNVGEYEITITDVVNGVYSGYFNVE